MKPEVLPIPIDGDLDALVREAAKDSGLKLADVMRQGLRHGVPALLEKLRVVGAQREPKCLDYLDDYPRATTTAKGYKQALRAKLAKKYDRPNH